MKSTTLLGLSSLPLFSLLPSAFAHGFLRSLTVDGTAYPGNVPNASPNPSVIRQINNVEPVKGATNRAVNCGQDAQIAQLSAMANPGSNLTFDWAGGDGSSWPHNIGPMMTYLASCGTTPCSSFDAINARWFKVDEAGQRDNGTWVQNDLFEGGTYTMSLPSDLAPGEYLVRHEILALHLATTLGGAEFYPSCSQITVGGNETGIPSSSDLVSLPGAYSDTDPGILDPDVFNQGATYAFPGPAIATLVDNDTATGNSTAALIDATTTTTASCANATSTMHTHTRMKTKHCSTSTATSTASTSLAVSTSTSTSASESTITTFAVTSTIFFLPSSTASSVATLVPISDIEAAKVRPRRLSRVMRGLIV